MNHTFIRMNAEHQLLQGHSRRPTEIDKNHTHFCTSFRGVGHFCLEGQTGHFNPTFVLFCFPTLFLFCGWGGVLRLRLRMSG